MRFRPLFLFCALLLAACSEEPGALRLDFVGATRFTSGNRAAAAGDTLTTRAYAETDAAGPGLKRLRITVTHEPSRDPFRYPVPATNFNPDDQPNDAPLLYLDSLVSGYNLLFQTTFGARTTSGTERWVYTVEDGSGNQTSRTFRVGVRKTDSLQVFHTYNIVARAVSPTGSALAKSQARRYLALYPGLLLPGFAIRNQPANPAADFTANQQLIDLIFVNNGGTITLKSPAPDTVSAVPQRRATKLRLSSVSGSTIGTVNTDVAFANTFNQAVRPSVAALTIAKDQVVAFQTSEGLYGLIYIADIVQTAQGTIIPCTVRIQKKP